MSENRRVKLKTQQRINTPQVKNYRGGAVVRESIKSEAKSESRICMSSDKCFHFSPSEENKNLLGKPFF